MQELILAGMSEADSPVMGAMMDMPAQSAYSIMNYMTTQVSIRFRALMAAKRATSV
jgi:hypothetical protein